MEEEKKVEETKVEEPKKKKSGILKCLYWLVVIGGCTFIFLGSYKIGYKLGNYFGEKKSGNTPTTKKESNSNVESNSNIESNSNVESNSNEVVTSNQQTEQKTQKTSVETILGYYKNIVTKNTGASYSVVDLNKDGIPELLIFKSGVDGGIECQTTIYTYDETKGVQSSNYIVNTGVLSDRFDNDTFLYALADGKIATQYLHMGYEIITTYEINNAKLTKVNREEKQTNETYQGKKFNVPAVKFVKTSDLSLINNYK